MKIGKRIKEDRRCRKKLDEVETLIEKILQECVEKEFTYGQFAIVVESLQRSKIEFEEDLLRTEKLKKQEDGQHQ